MSNKKNTVAIIGVLISLTILLFGNNIIGRLLSSEDEVGITKSVKEKPINSHNSIKEPDIDLIKEEVNTETIKGLVKDESNISITNSLQNLADEFLKDKESENFEGLIQNKNFEKALQVLKLAKSKTTKSTWHEIIENRRKSILLMIEKDFDNVWFSFPSKLILTERAGKQGLYSREGEEIIQPKYDEIDPFPFEPLLLTKKGEKYGFINEDGKEIYAPILTDVEPYHFDPLFLIEENGKSGFISKNGKIVVEPKFSEVWGRDGDLIIVEQNNKWGLIDSLGEEVVKIQFDSIARFDENGIALAILKGKKLFINQKGEKVKNPAFNKKTTANK